MRVLGLDPGGTTGFAYGDRGTNAPRSGAIRLDSSMTNGRKFCTLEGRIRNLIAVFEVDVIFVEAPYIQTDPKKFDIQVVRLGYGYQAAILMAAEKEGIGPERVQFVEPQKWRSATLKVAASPKGTKDNRGWLKNKAIEACRERGWPISSNDEAEACLIWEYGLEVTKPASTLGRLPLFSMMEL